MEYKETSLMFHRFVFGLGDRITPFSRNIEELPLQVMHTVNCRLGLELTDNIIKLHIIHLLLRYSLMPGRRSMNP